MDVSEFTPYVFQVLAQLLEYRPRDSGLGDAYKSLFPPLLTPMLWERKGNIPALTRLLQAYLLKGASEIVAMGQLMGLLGVFQKLVSSKANEASAFDLLSSVVIHVPLDAYRANLKDMFQILLVRLQSGKTPRFVRLATNFFALFIGKFGYQSYSDYLNSIQPGLGLMLVTQVWIPRLQTDTPVKMEAKIEVVGLTKILCETPTLLADTNTEQIWAQILAGTMKIITNPQARMGLSAGAGAEDADYEETEIGYDAAFSRLHFAARAVLDPFPEAKDPAVDFAKGLYGLCSRNPGKFPPLIQHALQADPKLAAGLESLVQKAGVSLV
uniref:Exportin-2 C-terminal domain-containing protein n=1 Tax=Trieres chinensis TaxID=1514140 RepID=A0A7S1Z2N2_TRICV|mmetsp:Transcript_16021/g.32896  ORF Transcript_16021/g.32896 Transcript_16021/m.32896 type:complete len:326 (+) Transcript_16021:44-1021(+)